MLNELKSYLLNSTNIIAGLKAKRAQNPPIAQLTLQGLKEKMKLYFGDILE